MKSTVTFFKGGRDNHLREGGREHGSGNDGQESREGRRGRQGGTVTDREAERDGDG